METVYANAGNCQETVNDVMRAVGPAASLRRDGKGYIVSDAGVDVVRIVTYTPATTWVEGPGGGMVLTSVGDPRF